MPSKIKSLITTLVFLMSTFAFANAAEINTPGFTGTVNTTATTGLSLRIDRNCLSVADNKALMQLIKRFQRILLRNQKFFYKTTPEGCAARYTDGYGNAGDNPQPNLRKC